ncbi:MAG: three-Cys-motif partner protein TcmP [Caldisericum exile]
MKDYPLKEVSKAKHVILQKYFPAWAKILGSRYQKLVYVDCFAGVGKYSDSDLGSPLIVLNESKELSLGKSLQFIFIFVEKDKKNAQILENNIFQLGLPSNIKTFVMNEDAHDFIPNLVKIIPDDVPSFFFIDPYGHPLSIPVINQILKKKRREVLINLMWYAINMHLENPRVEQAIDKMFGHNDWKNQNFMMQSGTEREINFVDYFTNQINARYNFKFRIRFSPKDRVPGGETRTKYYLIHFANHPRAILLMKEVMWPIGDEEGTFDFSASHQGVLFSKTPTVNELKEYLKQNYVNSGKEISFLDLRIETYHLPFIEKHYRQAIKELENEQLILVKRVQSKKTGIDDKDIVIFKKLL